MSKISGIQIVGNNISPIDGVVYIRNPGSVTIAPRHTDDNNGLLSESRCRGQQDDAQPETQRGDKCLEEWCTAGEGQRHAEACEHPDDHDLYP